MKPCRAQKYIKLWFVSLIHSLKRENNTEKEKKTAVNFKQISERKQKIKLLTGGWSPPSSLSKLPLELLVSGF